VAAYTVYTRMDQYQEFTWITTHEPISKGYLHKTVRRLAADNWFSLLITWAKVQRGAEGPGVSQEPSDSSWKNMTSGRGSSEL
jgi:hypothetical protein